MIKFMIQNLMFRICNSYNRFKRFSFQLKFLGIKVPITTVRFSTAICFLVTMVCLEAGEVVAVA